ncbi:MAG: hypothetical protein LC749_20865 [Actinobacteria bacterium]|nr:hypothetical protein [Actinomycetota bacterium]
MPWPAKATPLVPGPTEARRAALAGRALFGQGEFRAVAERTWTPPWPRLPPERCTRPARYTVVDLLVGNGLAYSRGTVREGVHR